MSTNESISSQSKRTKVSQSDFPQLSIQKSLRIIQALEEQYAGHPTAPHDIAMAIGLVPTSGSWRNLAGTSLAYGLTEGSAWAKTIELTPLGKRIVAPTETGDDKKALREAVLKPTIMRAFFEKYNRAKFPDTKIAENVLVSLGLPKDRATSAVEIIIENGVETGILRETQSGYFVSLDEPASVQGKVSAKSAALEGTSSSQPEKNDLILPAKEGKTRFSFGNGLYVNFEIHIAADTPVDTVEAIFKNMRKYLIEND